LFGFDALQLKEKSLNGLALATSPPDPPTSSGLESKTLDDLIFESADEVLTDLIGRKPKEAIYDYLERNYSIARYAIPKNLSKFVELLETTFGRGSATICRAIVRRLFQKLGWEFTEIRGFDFLDYLEAARARIARELIEQAKTENHRHTSL
jgi:hypothetical protein